MSTTATCSSCGAAIVWARTASGAATPLDAERVVGGTFEFNPQSGLVAAVGADGMARYRAHWATCPNANKHRRPRPKKQQLDLLAKGKP